MSFFSIFPDDLGIDLGTANTIISSVDNILLNEPSYISTIDDYSREKIPYLFGKEAKSYDGKNHEKIKVIRPLRQGTISNYRFAKDMIKYFINKISSKSIFGPFVIVCVPSGSTSVDRKAIQEAVIESGARDVYLVEEPMAAAIGAELPVLEPTGSIIVDIGGGTTEVGIISANGIVYGESIKVAGDEMDMAILNYVKKKFDLLISDSTAEKIKIQIGSACKSIDNSERVMEIRGRSLKTGLPEKIIITENQIAESLEQIVGTIIDSIIRAFEKSPPEISADILERGIFLAGGGSLLKNLDYVINKNTNIPVYVAEDPLLCVINGIRKILMDVKKYKNVLFIQD